MDRRTFLKHLSAATAALTTAAGARPVDTETNDSAPAGHDTQQDVINALRPPKRERPVVAIVVDSEGSETTDTLVPFGVLARSKQVDVFIVSNTMKAVPLYPALTILPQLTLAAFDRRFPEGPDYVVVPASHRLESSPLIPWIARQAETGATFIGVCSGAKSLAVAGLLKNRRATTHWYELDHLQRLEPDIVHVPDQRYVADGRIITTTGVTASLPVSLALVEAIAGPDFATYLGVDLGVASWSASHESRAFRLTPGAFFRGLKNRLSPQQKIGVPVSEGVSEIALAFTADAWSRTYRSQAVTVAEEPLVHTRHGLKLETDRQDMDALDAEEMLPEGRPAQALDITLERIATRFGDGTADFVALQLEYHRADP